MSLLEDYIKDINKLETAREKGKYKRIRSIDFVMGLAICLIILAHTSDAWLDSDWRYAVGLVYSILDVFGSSLFIFLSALSVVFSMSTKAGMIPEKVIRNNIFTRGISIIALGVVYNLISVKNVPFPLNLWGWNIIMFIGFAQIITYYALKLSRGSRIAAGVSIIFLTSQIREFLYVGKDTNPVIWILHFIIVSPAPHNPFVPYVSLCFFSTIFGEMFFEAMLLETEEAYKDVFHRFIRYGFFSIILGFFLMLLSGNILVTPNEYDINEYPFIQLVPIMQDQNYVELPGMPLILLKGTAANSFYSLGVALMILGVSFYYIDIKRKDNRFIDMLIFYGRVSLSLFFISYIWLFLFYRQVNIIFFFFLWGGYLGLLGILMYIWNKEWGGKYSLEWLMCQMGREKNK